ncbi:Peripheral-type benzodiazepine receptor-associated protein 1 [Chelonia mydas]|uniref:Peripheral-type benzodiazepine receptor-associated protein 1 n=1 Tax=Chelonia mydas TaxID=8469 RepID=M7BQU3_CHEMY|nr:Peripheral-type benzodiazepine receptor-associated protein 1 [Chelonia mydas]
MDLTLLSYALLTVMKTSQMAVQLIIKFLPEEDSQVPDMLRDMDRSNFRLLLAFTEQVHRPRLSRSLLEGPRPRSLESLIAAASPDGGAARSRSLDSSLAKPESSQAARQAPLEGSPPQSPCRGQQPAQKALEQAANPQEGAAKELPLKPTSQERPLECLDSPPEGKMGSWGSAGEGGTLAVGQQQEWLSGNNYSQLVKQNTDLLSALEDLERRCTALKEENGLLRRSSFPEMQEKVKRLKKKNADLAIIAKRLEERARKLQESNLKVVHAPIPLSLKGSNVELCKKAFARQRAKDLSEQASILLAKDKQIEALQRECWELQAKLATGKEGSCWLNLSDFDRLLRESQKEVLRLQRQITLKNLKESLQSSKMGPDSSSPAVTMCLIQETLAPNIDASLDGSSLPKQTPPGSITLAKDIKPVVLPLGNVSEEYENIPLKTDPDSKNQIQHLEVELSKKSKQCENLEQEMEKKQKKCEELEMQLQEVLTENAKVAEENAQLSGKTKWTEKVESENADLKVKLMGVTEERNSAVQLTKGLQTKVEDLEHVLKDMKEMAERRQQLEVDHEETLLALQKKEEEVKYLQQAQVEAKREHEEVVQLLEAQVRELENQYHSQTEHFNLLSQELEQLQIKNSDLVTSNLPHAMCCSSEDCHALQCSKNISDVDFVSTPAASKKQTKKLEFQSNSSKSESTQYSPKSCPTPEGDSASEVDELETDKFSLILEPERQGPAKLQVFLARYSYDPFDGPNKNPEAELPLTAGEYIYIYGEMDEDGFFEGELMDGRRGLVPSNLIEEVSDDDLMTFVPPKTSDLSHTSDHEMSFLSRSASSGEKRPPDAPLDVQVQPDPSADILVISWLPVTIDAAGSSNGVRVTGYAVYVNGQRVREVISPTAGSAIVELSQLDMLQGSQKVSVRTVSPNGESVDSVPALIPSAMLNVPSCSSSSKSMSTSLTSGLPYGEFIDSQHVKIPLTHCISSPSSEMFMASQDNKFTIHFTSNCRDSVASLPASIPPPQLFSSQSSSLIHELAMCNIGDNLARDKDDKCLKSYQQTAVSVQHSGLVFPTRWCEESVNSRMSPLKELAEDSQRKRIKELFVTKKAVLENQTDTSNMKMSIITHYVHSDDKSVKDSTTGDIEGYDESCLSSVPELCSSQLELEEDSYRDIGIHDICVQEVPDISTEKKQMKGLSEEVPSLATSRGEIKEDQISRTENWQLNPVGDHSHSSDLSDILEEEEEDLDLDTQEENRIKVVGNDSRLPELPEFPMQWAQNRKMSKALRIGQAGTSSFSRTGPLRSFVSEEIVNDDSVRIFVALFDYDPILMSPNLDAAEEELPFKKGQILKVVGDKDADGFYRGEYAGRVGYIPYNMVSEVQVESNETKQHLLKQGSFTDEKSVINLVKVDTQNNNKSRTEHSWQDSKAEQLTSKTMVAVFDYNPRENSLNVDVESELTFSAGDIITVFGSVDDDGLYYGELNGQRGLIPSDFLKTISWDEE